MCYINCYLKIGIGRAIKKHQNLRAIAPNNSGPQSEQLQARLQPESGSSGGDGVEHPRPFGLIGDGGGHLHRREPGRREGSDVDVESADLGREVRDLFDGVYHGRRSAGGEKDVGDQIHGDEVCDALD